MPTPNAIIVKKLKNYDPGLFVEWDKEKCLWMVKRKAPDGGVWHLFYVQEPDGTYRALDDRVMKEVYECDIMRHFESPGAYHRFIQDKNATVTLKEKNLREDYLRWWNRDHKTEWNEAIENAKRGVLGRNNEEPKPRTMIYIKKGDLNETV